MRAPWFVDINVPHTPILIAESSDSAFATRFRQAISSESQRHLPRVDYPDDEHILNLCEKGCAMPEPVRARYLVEAALRSLGRFFHILLRTVVVDELEQLLQNPGSVSIFVRSKLLAAFAIGELYTTRASVTMDSFPGLAYFARATRVHQIVPERPNITVIETKLLLASSGPYQSPFSPC
jgi:proline utilization trans-activator